MSTPRYIRRQNTVLVGYLYRTTRIYSIAALLTLVFGAVLAGMTHKFSQWWISVSLTLFVVAFVLLVLIMRDQRTAVTALTTADDTVAAGRGDTVRSAEVVPADEAASEGPAPRRRAAISPRRRSLPTRSPPPPPTRGRACGWRRSSAAGSPRWAGSPR